MRSHPPTGRGSLALAVPSAPYLGSARIPRCRPPRRVTPRASRGTTSP
jgi:hypothetical protein